MSDTVQLSAFRSISHLIFRTVWCFHLDVEDEEL